MDDQETLEAQGDNEPTPEEIRTAFRFLRILAFLTRVWDRWSAFMERVEDELEKPALRDRWRRKDDGRG